MIGGMEMVVLIVLITTIGKVLTSRSQRGVVRQGPDPEAIAQLNDAMSDMHTRLSKLEEERDFYRALLEAPRGARTPEPPGPPPEGPATDETPGPRSTGSS